MMLAGFCKRSITSLRLLYAVLFLALAMQLPRADADVVKTVTASQPALGIPLTEWRDDSQKPRAVAVAIHGLVMHGGVYDSMARELARQGIIVIAPDLRGYGHWVDSSGHKLSDSKKLANFKNGVDYKKSHADMLALTTSVKNANPELPLYLIGESLGADMALHVASDLPGSVDGLILSAPSVKHRWFVKDLVCHAPIGLTMPFKQIYIGPQIQKYFSDDSEISDATMNDPLVRKRMSAIELLKTGQEASRCLHYARKISPNMPVLVMQGGADMMLDSEAVSDLLATIPSQDQKLEWFSQRGHLLLETSLVYSDTMTAVSGWLNNHLQERATTRSPLVATAE